YLRVGFLLIRGLYCCLQVTHIVQAVKDTDNIDSVCHGFLNKVFNNVIRIGTVSQNVLPAEKHLQLGMFEAVAEFTESLPRILFQETEGCVKGSAAPALYRVVAYLI